MRNFEGKMANFCPNVRGNKTNQRYKQNKHKPGKQTNKQKTTKREDGGGGRKSRYLTLWSSDVIIVTDLRETEGERGSKHVLLHLHHKHIQF